MAAKWKSNPLDPVWRVRTTPEAQHLRSTTPNTYDLAAQIEDDDFPNGLNPNSTIHIHHAVSQNPNHITRHFNDHGDVRRKNFYLKLDTPVPHTVEANPPGYPLAVPITLIEYYEMQEISRDVTDLLVDVTNPLELVRPVVGLIFLDNDGNLQPLRVQARGGSLAEGSHYLWQVRSSYRELVELNRVNTNTVEISVPQQLFDYIGEQSVKIQVRVATRGFTSRGLHYAPELDFESLDVLVWEKRPRISNLQSDNMQRVSVSGNYGVFSWRPDVDEAIIVFPIHEIFEDLHIPTTQVTFSSESNDPEDAISPHNQFYVPPPGWETTASPEFLIHPQFTPNTRIINEAGGSFDRPRRVQYSSAILITATDGTGETVSARFFVQRAVLDGR